MGKHQMIYGEKELAQIIDISSLSPKAAQEDVEKLAKAAAQYEFIAAFVLPYHIAYLKEQLGENSKTIIGAPIGFPTGADLTQDKVFQTKEMMKLGCKEFDMVMAIGKLKSSLTDYVKQDIARVIDAADGYPVKVILEVTYLTDDEIKLASEIVAASGAQYVKTGTGYSPMPTQVKHVEIMKQTVGDSVKIKVAGGVKSLDIIESFFHAGAQRFGIGMESALEIMRELDEKN